MEKYVIIFSLVAKLEGKMKCEYLKVKLNIKVIFSAFMSGVR